jgi:hypothetical protein
MYLIHPFENGSLPELTEPWSHWQEWKWQIQHFKRWRHLWLWMVPFVPTLVSTYGCGALALSLTLLSCFFVLGHKNTQHPSYHMKAPHDSHCMYMYVYVFLVYLCTHIICTNSSVLTQTLSLWGLQAGMDDVCRLLLPGFYLYSRCIESSHVTFLCPEVVPFPQSLGNGQELGHAVHER